MARTTTRAKAKARAPAPRKWLGAAAKSRSRKGSRKKSRKGSRKRSRKGKKAFSADAKSGFNQAMTKATPYGHISGDAGVPSKLTLKLKWVDTISFTGGAAIAYSLVANALINEISGGTPYGYIEQWAGFYNYYRVNANKIKLQFTNNSGTQDFVCGVWPAVIDPSTSGSVPTALDGLELMPGVKTAQVGPFYEDSAQRTIDYYVNFSKFFPDNDFKGTDTAGNMPSVPNGGTGSNPSSNMWWTAGIYTTNQSDSGSITYDLTFMMEAFVDLFSPVPQTDVSSQPKFLRDSIEWQKENPLGAIPVDPLAPTGQVGPMSFIKVIDLAKYMPSPPLPADEPVIIPHTAPPPAYPKSALKVRFPIMR